MHVVKESQCVIRIRVVALGKKDEMVCKFRVTIERLHALEHITKIDFVSFAANDNLFGVKTWLRRR